MIVPMNTVQFSPRMVSCAGSLGVVVQIVSSQGRRRLKQRRVRGGCLPALVLSRRWCYSGEGAVHRDDTIEDLHGVE